MFIVARESSFSAAHRVSESGGACENLHGHNWKVKVHVRAEQLDAIGMVVDFKVLKKTLEEVLNHLDHVVLNEVPPFDRLNPTSENIAYHILQSLAKRIDDERIEVFRVDVWETENSMATVVKQ